MGGGAYISCFCGRWISRVPKPLCLSRRRRVKPSASRGVKLEASRVCRVELEGTNRADEWSDRRRDGLSAATRLLAYASCLALSAAHRSQRGGPSAEAGPTKVKARTVGS